MLHGQRLWRKTLKSGRGWSTSIFAATALFFALGSPTLDPQQSAPIVGLLDASVYARIENVLSFTDVEHYAVYRGHDETHPVAELTVRDNYVKGSGKTYTILSESGSALLQRVGLHPLLDREKEINKPGNIEKSWFTSANYTMRPKSGGTQPVNGRNCFALDITPHNTAPNLIIGTLWVDASDGSIVKVEGVASKDPSPFSGTTHMMRQYTQIDGFPMANHARAESSSLLLGRTVVTIDYSDYNIQLKTPAIRNDPAQTK